MQNLFSSLRSSLIVCKQTAAKTNGVMAKFEDFPHNCSEFTSLIVAKYLYDKGITRISIITSELNIDSNIRHYWLEVCGYTVDLTADQFIDGEVCLWDLYSLWHLTVFNKLNSVTFMPTRDLVFNEHDKTEFDNFFEEFCNNISKV